MLLNNLKSKKFAIHAADLLALHFLAFSIGLVRLVMAVTHQVYVRMPFDTYTYGIFDWAAGAQLDKLDQLLAYGIPIGVLFIYFFLALGLILQTKNATSPHASIQPPLLGVFAYLSGVLALNITIAALGINTPLLILFLWGLGFTLVPVLYLTAINVINWLLKPYQSLALLGVMLIQLGLIFWPLIFSPIFIRGDYLNIPEYTKLNNGWVDNIKFINAHNIAGLRKYDPRVDQGVNQDYSNAVYVQIRNTPLLIDFIEKFSKNSYNKFTYDNKKGWLIAYGQLTQDELSILEGIYNNPAEKEKVIALYLASTKYAGASAATNLNEEGRDFLNKNKDGLANQIKAGWFFHHHNYMFGPMIALALGVPHAEVTMVYGWLNTMGLGSALKVLGGVNYQSYFKLFFSVYPLYYLLLGLITYIIFRKLPYVLLVMMGTLGAVFLTGYPLTIMAPGFNPARHFFDLLTFVFLYLYFFSTQRRWIYLAATLGVAGFFILWNREFGIFTLLAVLGALLYDGFGKPRFWRRLVILLIAGIIGTTLYFLPVAGKNPGFIYMLLGVSGPAISKGAILQMLLVIIAIYALLFFLRAQSGPLHSLAVGLFLYCQLALVYVVWFPAMHHVLNLAPALVIFCASLLRLLFMQSKFKMIEERSLSVLIVIILMAYYVPSSAFFALSEINYKDYEGTHRIYKWDFERAQFQTSMEPTLFTEAVLQVQKYEQGNKMYLISKYDNLLPVLSGKYNDLPVLEVATNLVTSKEVTLVADRIRQRAPAYIFMDTDITRNLNGEITRLAPTSWVVESTVRVQILSKLNQIREALSDIYIPVETGRLLTVYQRRDLLN